MEKIIIKTIREAFKKAYINKLLKEGSDDLLNKLNPNMRQKAMELYPLWISGKKRIKYGEINQDTMNYILERAIEEYKQTKDDRIRNVIASAFYPENGSKIWVRLKYHSPYSKQVFSAIRQSRGESVSDSEIEEEINDLISEGWIEALGSAEGFNKLLDLYKTDSETGIGGLIFTRLANEIRSAAMKATAKKRGGQMIGHRFGDSPEGQDDYEKKLRGAEDFLSPEARGEEDFGSDVASQDEFDITDTGGEEETAIDKKSMAESLSLDKLKKTFADLKNVLQADEKMEPRIKAVLMNFFEGKTASETYAENPEFFARPGKDEKQTRNEVYGWPTIYFAPPKGDKKGSKYFYIADDIGIANGLPQGWLKFILEQKKFVQIAKFLSNPNSGNLNESEGKARIMAIFGFDTPIEFNVDEILKEVYRRLGQKK